MSTYKSVNSTSCVIISDVLCICHVGLDVNLVRATLPLLLYKVLFSHTRFENVRPSNRICNQPLSSHSPHLSLEEPRLPILSPRRALEVPEVLVRLGAHDFEEGVVVEDALF